jgi:hypothetical protein
VVGQEYVHAEESGLGRGESAERFRVFVYAGEDTGKVPASQGRRDSPYVEVGDMGNYWAGVLVGTRIGTRPTH